MKIHIRNMVCERRIVAVRKIFAEAGHHPVSVLLGEVDTSINIVREDLMNIGEKLVNSDLRSSTIAKAASSRK